MKMNVDMNQMYKKMLDNMYEGIYYVDNERTITFWNKGAERITGFLADEVVNSHCYDNILNHVDDFGNKLCFAGCPLQVTLNDGKTRDHSIYLHHKEGHRVAVKVRVMPIYEEGIIVGAVEMFIGQEDNFHNTYDIEELKQLAFRDALTGLPNRRMLDEQLAIANITSHEMNYDFGIALMDIDNFKNVNDTYGHSMGDNVLKMVAKSLQSGIMRTDIIARWGGEEFICLLRGTDEESLKRVAERLRMLIQASGIRMNSNEVKVTISIGATLHKAGETIEDMIERADKLLYQSKQDGRNRITIG